jgi:hypothetical protein
MPASLLSEPQISDLWAKDLFGFGSILMIQHLNDQKILL